MSFRNAVHSHGKRSPWTVFVLAAVAATALASCANSNRLADLGMKPHENAMTSHEKARQERAAAVEHARMAFERAKAAGAEWAAPYEYYTAEEYLILSREELSSGDVIGVVHFASESERHSILAIDKATEVRQ